MKNNTGAIMKNLMLLTVLTGLLGVSSASAQCLGEAQIIAKVESIRTADEATCTVNLDANSVTQWNENMLCPLDVSTVLQAGVITKTQRGEFCDYAAGDELTGVLVLNDQGQVILE
jgi:hypothetical protein